MLHFSFPIQSKPEVVQTGLSLHGYKKKEKFFLKDLWGFHLYLYSGSLEINQEIMPFSPGWVSLTPPNTHITWTFPSHAPHYYFHFRVEPRPGGKVVEMPVTLQFPQSIEDISARLERITHAFHENTLRTEAGLWELLWESWEISQLRPSSETFAPAPTVQIAVSILRNSLSSKISIGELANRVGVSHNHLTNLFNETFGITPVEYLRKVRCNQALHLLTNTSLSITSIAQEVGIPDLHYFNKTIRKEFGHSPTALRQSGGIISLT